MGDYANAASDIVKALEIDADNKAFYMISDNGKELYKPLSARLKAMVHF